LFVSVEHLDGSFIENENQVTKCLTAGVNYEYAGSALPSRFPHLVSSLSIDDKLLKFTLEVKEGPKLQAKGITRVKARLVLGDVEATVTPAALRTITESADQLNATLKKSSADGIERQVDSVAKPTTSYHVKLRLTSVRCLLRDVDIFAAIALTETGFRLAKSPQRRLQGQRSELIGRCGNIQVLWVRDFEAGRGIELFGKREVHSPIMFVRLRTQETSESENGGWIVESPPTSVDVDIDSLVLGMHLGIRIEGLSVSVTPESLDSIGCRLVRMGKSIQYQKSTLGASAKLIRIEKPRRQKMRWRVDCLLKKSFVSFQDKVEFRDDFLTTEVAQEKLSASFAACVVVQPTESLSNEASVQVHVQDASLIKSPGDVAIVEPISFVLDIVAPLVKKFPKSSRNPLLHLREGSPWAVILPPSVPKIEGRIKCQVDVSCSLLSEIKIRFSPSTLRVLLELLASFSLSLKILRATDVEEKGGSSSRNESKEKGHSIGVALTAGTASFAIVREAQTPIGATRRAETAVLFCVEGIQFVTSMSFPTVSFEAVMAYCSVIDYSHRAGIHTLKAGYRYLNASPAASSFVEVQCSVNKVAGQRHLHSSVQVGDIQFLPLPSCVRAIIDFIEESKRPKAEQNGGNPQGTANPVQNALGIATVAFEARSGLFECILSSRDLPRHLREMSNHPIGVVTLRLKVSGRGLIQLKDFQSLIASGDDFIGGSVSAGVENSLSRYLNDRIVGSATGVFSELEVAVTNFQVLRTTISRSITVPIVFAVKPPLIGEQRITNAFNFTLVHRAACSSFSAREASEPSATFSIAHSLDISADTVDVLLYISQSAGGVHDAIRTSAIPILDLLKKKDEGGQSKPTNNAGFRETILCAAFSCSLSIEGFVVTCVPGGATRLTESPIVKLSLSSLSGGLATTPISTEWNLLQKASDQPASPITNVKVRHIFAGGWLVCGVSGYYNNRRLVEWEPFVEPWKLELLLGADVSRATKLGPLLDDKPWHNRTAVRLQRQPSNPLDFGGSRLRDIGRLLRSPFQTDSSGKTNVIDTPKAVQSDIDFCYLVLTSMSAEIVSRATLQRGPFDRSVLSSLLPHDKPIQWLRQFGYPTESDLSVKELLHHPALICKLVDSAPLNLNLTGALLENLSDYLGKGNDGNARRLAPHWIRNDSGLVSTVFLELCPSLY
jgi:hypothetical protein